jgi:hypothetical protein
VGEQKKKLRFLQLIDLHRGHTSLDRVLLMILEHKIKDTNKFGVWRGVNVSLTYKTGLKINSKICGYPSFSPIDHYLLWTGRQL